MSDAETIYAVSSGQRRAGVAIIRISGRHAARALDTLAGGVPPPRLATLRTLRAGETGEALDRGLVLWFPAPHSYTGEDVGELHIHGGRASVAAVLRALSAVPDLRAAVAGEFTRRAFAHGRMDLTEVEGLGDLISADTEAQRRLALRVALGEHRALYEGWRARLIEAMSLIEAMIDFSDETDVPDDTRDAAASLVASLRREITAHLAEARDGERLRDGVQIVIAGPPNVGKSTLLNRIAKRDVAIVSAEAGTTRDMLEAHLDLCGYPVTLVDTAGMREAMGAVEREGVRRAAERVASADLVLWLSAPGIADIDPPVGREVWRVANKADLGGQPGALSVSALTGDGLDTLLTRLGRFAAELIGDATDAPFLARLRHRDSLTDCLAHLDAARAVWHAAPVEIVAEELRHAATALGRITGRVDVEDLLDKVFMSFCVGK